MRVHRRIVADPEILGGKPVLENTRLSVTHILGLLGNGMSVDQVVESYPILDKQDVLDMLAYAAQSLENEEAEQV